MLGAWREARQVLKLILAAAMTLVIAAPAAATEPDNTLIRTAFDGAVYRVVGQAPLHLGKCPANPNDTCQPIAVNDLSGYRQYPSDGVVTYGGSDGGIYRWAGGAPLWLSRCDYGGGCASGMQIDDTSYSEPAHVRPTPADSTVIRNVDDGGYYRFAGGAPLVVRCDIGAGCVDPPQFDRDTFATNGSARPGRENMRSHPDDGTTVTNVDDGVFYRFAGGAPLPLSGCSGCSAVIIDNRTLQLSGSATPGKPRLLPTPLDGTYLTTGAAVYRIAGGAAVQLTDCSVLEGCPGAVAIDAGTISSLGGGRLTAAPADGTVLRGLPSGRRWEIVGGTRRETFVRVTGVDVDDGAIALIPEPSMPAPVAPVVFKPAITSSYTVSRKGTRFKSLSVRDVPAGSKVTVTCSRKSRGCPFRSKSYTAALKDGRANLVSRFKHRRIRGGVTLTVKITGPTGARKYQYFKLRTKKLPVRSTRCSAPGAKLGRC